jgi:DNA-binding response OmpR family regulator
MTHLPNILLAGDVHAACTRLPENLLADRYRVRNVDDIPATIAVLRTPHPDLVLADMNGETLVLLDRVRGGEEAANGVDPDVPIIVIASTDDELNRVRLLDRGADDVLDSPVSYPELRARVAALLRRAHTRTKRRALRVEAMRADLTSREVKVGDHVLALTPIEFSLIATLARDPARVFTRGELMREIWGFRTHTRSRTLDTHAARLRHKLAQAGAPGLVQNVRGVGLRFTDLPDAA